MWPHALHPRIALGFDGRMLVDDVNDTSAMRNEPTPLPR